MCVYVCVGADFADESEQIGASASLEGHAYRGPDAAPEDLQGKEQVLTMQARTNQEFVAAALKYNGATSALSSPSFNEPESRVNFNS